MNITLNFWIGYACGATTFTYFAWRIHRRMLARMFTIRNNEVVARNLENRRDAIDFGRTDEVREDAGPAGVESSLFELRPGRMTFNHLQEKKLPKAVDTQQD